MPLNWPPICSGSRLIKDRTDGRDLDEKKRRVDDRGDGRRSGVNRGGGRLPRQKQKDEVPVTTTDRNCGQAYRSQRGQCYRDTLMIQEGMDHW